jgi:predicted amidohydrolase
MKPYDHISRHIIPARAIENQVYIAYANRFGSERDLRYVGMSGIYDPRGRVIAQGADGSLKLLVASVSKSTVLAARSEFHYVEEVRKVCRAHTKVKRN